MTYLRCQHIGKGYLCTYLILEFSRDYERYRVVFNWKRPDEPTWKDLDDNDAWHLIFELSRIFKCDVLTRDEYFIEAI